MESLNDDGDRFGVNLVAWAWFVGEFSWKEVNKLQSANLVWV
jgi:hypothetical protein